MTSCDATAPDAPQDPAGAEASCRYFITYTGVKVPFKLVEPIAAEHLTHRNTFIKAYFDAAGVLTGFDKMVYGEVELAHRYAYHANGRLSRADVTMDEETVILAFDESGAPVAGA
ncbi:DUF6156 family protein [Xanthobacter agilis]|uniref:Lipoprotein n=1 Tax=Xanthobacter agilis TaxID=47492 RepID=A0ABU0LDQ3_XANAG|nr:DUF6156 family protein [Xanthobacter agilis]MDQ0505253.1 hypothetical protein [Xanthobacter agilis]